MRRHTAAVLGILVGLGTAACTDSSGPHPRGPGKGTAAGPTVVASHAADVLLSVHSTGGMGDPGSGVPDVEVRTDGTVYVASDVGLGVDTFTLTTAGVERVREGFASVSMSQDDYEESDWTDQPSTSVYSTLGERPERISVYGLHHDDEVDDDDWDRLLAALDDVDRLAGRAARGVSADVATPRATYRPATAAVLLDVYAGPASQPWPLSTPLHRSRVWWTGRHDGCLDVSGKDVVTLESMADDHGRDGLEWSTGGSARSGLPANVVVEIRPVLRDTPPPCTQEAPEEMSLGFFYSVRLGDPATWQGLRPTARWQVPEPFDLADVTDEVEAAVTGALSAASAQGHLSSYDTEWVVGTAHGRRYVEVAGVYPEKYRDDEPDVPTTWQVRVEAVTGTALALEVEGEPVPVS